jgi:hypothetical protein
MWSDAGYPGAGGRPGEGDIIMRVPGAMEIPRYHAAAPDANMSGDYEAMALYAGTGVGRIADVRSAASLIAEIVAAAAANMPR